MNIIEYLLDFIYPKECAGCHREGWWICPKCKKQIVPIKSFYCPKCKKITPNGQFCSTCRRHFALTGIIIAAHFHRGPLREAIHSYKYESIFGLEDYFRPLLIHRLRDRLPKGDKIIIPIPLHPKKKKYRGFNQAERLAKIIAEEFTLPLELNALKRIKKTEAQMSLSKKERRQNIKGAFRINRQTNLKNKTILLVDDVATTGLTLNEAAIILSSAGARRIWGVVIAKD